MMGIRETVSDAKCFFLDYMGTMVREDGDPTKKIVGFYLQNSDFKQADEAVAYVWKWIKKLEESRYKDNFATEDEIVEQIMEESRKEAHLKGDFEQLHGLFQDMWRGAPLFDDVRLFFETCGKPVYVITNNAARYVSESMQRNHIMPAGIISAEDVRAYKPHREIFDRALEVCGFQAGEVFHIGDSVSSDVRGAQNAGIRPILLDRAGKQDCSDVVVISSLADLCK